MSKEWLHQVVLASMRAASQAHGDGKLPAWAGSAAKRAASQIFATMKEDA